MQRRQAKRVHRPLTAEERERWERACREVEVDKPRLTAIARQVEAERDALLAPLRQAIAELRRLRQSQGLSQAVVRERTGIHSKAISRLENDLEANPTVATLIRYAHALGKRLVIEFADEPSQPPEGRLAATEQGKLP
jgi:DNA-binding XRE family transcriptional regulator